jgi:hypothetical protein
MQAVQGTYNNGTFTLNRQAPVKTGKVIVIFTEAEPAVKRKMPKEEALKIFHKYAGSLKRNVNIKDELMEALDERYENTN